MLFKQDLFQLMFERQIQEGTPPKDDPQSALEMSLEFYRADNWSDAYDILKSFVPYYVKHNSRTPLECQILGLAAICRSAMEAMEHRWGIAADWLWSAMTRCVPFPGDLINANIPLQYMLLCSAMAGSEKVLSFELSQLHIKLDTDAFSNLALAFVKLSFIGTECLDEAVSGSSNLRAHILEHLQTQLGNRDRRRAEFNIVEQVSQKMSSLLEDTHEAVDSILQESTINASMRQKTGRLRQVINVNDKLLLSEEREHAQALNELFGVPLASLTESLTASPPLDRRTKIDRFIANATGACAQIEKGGLYGRCICLPVVQHLRALAVQESGIASMALAPKVTVKQSTKKYPIDQAGETIRLQTELVNEGSGTAEQCEVTFVDPTSKRLSFIRPMPIIVDPIPAGRYANLECSLRLNEGFDTLKIPVNITCKDIFGKPYVFEGAVTIERQAKEVDWDQLLDSAPYSLTPVSTLEGLRGRSSALNQLKLNAAVGTSTALWKSSTNIPSE